MSAVTAGELAGSLGAGAVVVDRLGPRIVAAQLAAAALLAGLRMRLTPAALHGRLFALLRTAMQATPPLGAGLAAVTVPSGVTATVAAVVAVMAVPALLAAPGLARTEVQTPG